MWKGGQFTLDIDIFIIYFKFYPIMRYYLKSLHEVKNNRKSQRSTEPDFLENLYKLKSTFLL